MNDLARIDVQHGVGPLAELFLVLRRRAEQRGDHHHREASSEVGDVVERPRADELVEKASGQRADASSLRRAW